MQWHLRLILPILVCLAPIVSLGTLDILTYVVGVLRHVWAPGILFELLHLMATVKATGALVIFSSSGLLCNRHHMHYAVRQHSSVSSQYTPTQATVLVPGLKSCQRPRSCPESIMLTKISSFVHVNGRFNVTNGVPGWAVIVASTCYCVVEESTPPEMLTWVQEKHHFFELNTIIVRAGECLEFAFHSGERHQVF